MRDSDDDRAPCATRRHFLQILGAGAATVVACGGNNKGTEATGDIPGGKVSDLSIGTLRLIDGQPVVVARDAGGVYAMSTICTHAQCDMRNDGTIANNGMTCTCHGSSFDAQGQPTGGPAGSPVKHFAVEIAADGTITIHASTSVNVATRVPVAGT